MAGRQVYADEKREAAKLAQLQKAAKDVQRELDLLSAKINNFEKNFPTAASNSLPPFYAVQLLEPLSRALERYNQAFKNLTNSDPAGFVVPTDYPNIRALNEQLGVAGDDFSRESIASISDLMRDHLSVQQGAEVFAKARREAPATSPFKPAPPPARVAGSDEVMERPPPQPPVVAPPPRTVIPDKVIIVGPTPSETRPPVVTVPPQGKPEPETIRPAPQPPAVAPPPQAAATAKRTAASSPPAAPATAQSPSPETQAALPRLLPDAPELQAEAKAQGQVQRNFVPDKPLALDIEKMNQALAKVNGAFPSSKMPQELRDLAKSIQKHIEKVGAIRAQATISDSTTEEIDLIATRIDAVSTLMDFWKLAKSLGIDWHVFWTKSNFDSLSLMLSIDPFKTYNKSELDSLLQTFNDDEQRDIRLRGITPQSLWSTVLKSRKYYDTQIAAYLLVADSAKLPGDVSPLTVKVWANMNLAANEHLWSLEYSTASVQFDRAKSLLEEAVKIAGEGKEERLAAKGQEWLGEYSKNPRDMSDQEKKDRARTLYSLARGIYSNMLLKQVLETPSLLSPNAPATEQARAMMAFARDVLDLDFADPKTDPSIFPAVSQNIAEQALHIITPIAAIEVFPTDKIRNLFRRFASKPDLSRSEFEKSISDLSNGNFAVLALAAKIPDFGSTELPSTPATALFALIDPKAPGGLDLNVQATKFHIDVPTVGITTNGLDPYQDIRFNSLGRLLVMMRRELKMQVDTKNKALDDLRTLRIGKYERELASIVQEYSRLPADAPPEQIYPFIKQTYNVFISYMESRVNQLEERMNSTVPVVNEADGSPLTVKIADLNDPDKSATNDPRIAQVRRAAVILDKCQRQLEQFRVANTGRNSLFGGILDPVNATAWLESARAGLSDKTFRGMKVTKKEATVIPEVTVLTEAIHMNPSVQVRGVEMSVINILPEKVYVGEKEELIPLPAYQKSHPNFHVLHYDVLVFNDDLLQNPRYIPTPDAAFDIRGRPRFAGIVLRGARVMHGTRLETQDVLVPVKNERGNWVPVVSSGSILREDQVLMYFYKGTFETDLGTKDKGDEYKARAFNDHEPELSRLTRGTDNKVLYPAYGYPTVSVSPVSYSD